MNKYIELIKNIKNKQKDLCSAEDLLINSIHKLYGKFVYVTDIKGYKYLGFVVDYRLSGVEYIRIGAKVNNKYFRDHKRNNIGSTSNHLEPVGYVVKIDNIKSIRIIKRFILF